MAPSKPKPKLAVFKFASCDGCQLSLLDCEDELLAVVGEIEIANFLEASREVVKGPYDVALVEGSITTPDDAERIQQVRRSRRFLVTIGACATAGGIQALRNFEDVREFTPARLRDPEYISTLEASTPIAQHVRVDFELRGCPINKAPAPRGARRLPGRAQAQHPDLQRLHRVQAPGNGLRDGRPRHALPRPGHPGRLRRALPLLRPRLLRLLRPDGVAEHGLPAAAGGSSTWARPGRTSMRAFRTFNACAEAFRKESEAYEHERT